MEPLSVLFPIAGGLLIGLAAAIFLVFNGRVAGISGLLAITTRTATVGAPWSQAAAFVVGIPLGAGFAAAFIRHSEITTTSSIPVLIFGGILVGFGTRLGNGCTSGHGVCGISRLSRRSLIATLVFMVSAALTVLLVRHIGG